MDPSCQGIPQTNEKGNSAPGEHPQTTNIIVNEAVVKHSLLEQNRHGWRHVVLNFTPSWFTVIMGTGIVSILIHNLPYNGHWLYWISVVIFALNVFLFGVFIAISLVRYTMFPGIWMCVLRHPVQSLFLGTIPMGLATIIIMIILVCVPAWGPWAAILAWVLWWIDCALALSTNMFLPFVIMYHNNSKIQSMTAVWLMPIVATIVASAAGAVVATGLENEQYALWTVILSYVLWGTGIPLSVIILAIYFQRLTMHSLPAREHIISVFLPMGTLGQGAFAIMQLGADARDIFPKTHSLPQISLGGEILYANGFMIGLIMWGFSLVWLFFAIASIIRVTFPINLGAWGFVFPLGVFANATLMLSKQLPSGFLRVLGTIFSVSVVMLWIAISLMTIVKTLSGELLYAPCLADWEKAYLEKKLQHEETKV